MLSQDKRIEEAKEMKRIVEAAWEITSLCNLNCKHCYSKGMSNDGLSKEDVFRVLEEMKCQGIEKVKYGGGEPLKRNDFLDIFAKTKELKFETTFSTNGILINDNLAKELKKLGLHKLQISLDGMKDTHDKMRGKEGLFEKVMESIEILKKNSIGIDIATTLMTTNKEDIPNMLELCRYLEIRRWRVMKYIPCGNGDIRMMLPPKGYKETVDYLLNEKKVNDKKPEIIVAREFDYICQPMDYNDMQCVGGKTFISIKTNGNVTPCSFFDNLVAGNLKEKSLGEILKNEVLDKFANIEHFNPKCKYSKKCQGGCKAAAYYANGIFSCDPYCWIQNQKLKIKEQK